MFDELKDLRCKITSLTWRWLEAERIVTGKDHSEIVRAILQDWADLKDRIAKEALALIDESEEIADGFIYVVRVGSRYKIGKSIDWRRRISSFNFPEPPEVVCVIETDSRHTLEQTLHRKFAAVRAHGEWFDLNHFHLEEIRQLPGAKVPT